MNFLGLRLCDHDSNITLTVDGKVYYYKSERDSQIKHWGYKNLTGWLKPFAKWGVPLSKIDAIGIVVDCFRYKSINYDENNIFEKIDIPLFRDMGYKGPIYRIDHHYAHAESAWMLTDKSDIDFVFDGFGDNKLSHSRLKNGQREFAVTYNTHPSFGSTMGDVGAILNLQGISNDMAGKVMALKAMGRYSQEDMDRMKRAQKTDELTIADIREFWDLWKLGQIVKNKPQQFACDHIQFAHEVSEDIYEAYFLENTKEDDVFTYSGGIALNTIINSRIKLKRPGLVVPPHCNDEGLSLGIVEVLRKHYKEPKLSRDGFPFWQSDEAPERRPSSLTIKKTAEMLAEGKIVGWYQGHGEVGPRALGNRSILMDPSVKGGKDIINEKVKHREMFRPFGASILSDELPNYFDWEYDSPYMLYVMDVKDKFSFGSITHFDGTCRPQSVEPEHEDYYQLISEFEGLTGIPMVLNTSLNNGGAPIAGSPIEALQLMHETELDAVVVGDDIYTK